MVIWGKRSPLQAVGEGEQDGDAGDTQGFGGLLGEVGVGDVFEEAAGAEALELPAGDRDGVEVVAAESIARLMKVADARVHLPRRGLRRLAGV